MARVEYSEIVQPIIDLNRLNPVDDLGLPTTFQLPKMTDTEKWTINVHKCIDKAAATEQGKQPDEPWLDKLTVFVNQDLKREMDSIGKFVLSKNTMFDLIRDKVKEQVTASKKLGLIRLGCLYDLMQRQI